MSALPPYESSSLHAGERSAVIARKWATLHADAAQLATMADLAPEAGRTEITAFTERLERASDWQCRLAIEAIDDMDAMMQPGLAALRVIAGRGQSAVAPALALWREFYAAREAVIAMVAVSEPAHR